MPLPILLTLVIAGIAGIALVLHVFGLSKPRLILDKAEAASSWLREFPAFPVVDVILSHTATAALIQTRQGNGLVWSIGADTVARQLQDYDVFPTPTGLRINFHDFTAPHVNLQLDESERQHWQNLLEAP